MIEFLRKYENRSIKIARVNSILITKFINLQLFSVPVKILEHRVNFFEKNGLKKKKLNE